MSYVGRAVRFQHRVATGKAGLKSNGQGQREHVPVPTALIVSDAFVRQEVFAGDGQEPRLFLVYSEGDTPVIGSDWQSGMNVAFDVPHRDHADAQHEMFWWDPHEDIEQLEEALIATRKESAALKAENEALKAQFAATTEGKDAALQAKADEHAVPSSADLDAVAEEEKAAEATASKKIRVIKGK